MHSEPLPMSPKDPRPLDDSARIGPGSPGPGDPSLPGSPGEDDPGVPAGFWSRLALAATPFVLLVALFLADRWIRG
jgi:hypothetical protein